MNSHIHSQLQQTYSTSGKQLSSVIISGFPETGRHDAIYQLLFYLVMVYQAVEFS